MSSQLGELFPKRVEFEILDADSKPFVKLAFKPFTINDSNWIRENIGDQDFLDSIFRDGNFSEISRIAYRQLEGSSKKKLFKLKFEYENDFDDYGKPLEVKLTGTQRLMEICRGPENEVRLIESLLKSRGFNSSALIDEETLSSGPGNKKKE